MRILDFIALVRASQKVVPHGRPPNGAFALLLYLTFLIVLPAMGLLGAPAEALAAIAWPAGIVPLVATASSYFSVEKRKRRKKRRSSRSHPAR